MNSFISVVIPIRNEENYIEGFLNSLMNQNYPKESMEWIFVDGVSEDRTKEILEKYKEEYPELIKILDNPDKTVPYAMNIGIRASKGEYIIRLDAHSEYDFNYIERCVFYLDNSYADNVGGVARTKSRGKMGAAIGKMLSSPFGVGDSQFRINGESGYVDTVPFGAFRREVFDRVGLFDERLTRNQDNEMNFRIRQNGGKILLQNDIRFTYYARETVGSLMNMAKENGKWNIITGKLCPGAMGLRHFIPLIFVLSLIVLIPLSFLKFFKYILFAELIAYFALALVFAFRTGRSIPEMGKIFILYPIFHISYGIGSLIGIWETYVTKKALEG